MIKIRIYQINTARDVNRICFMAYKDLGKIQGCPEVDSKIYDKVYDNEVECRGLEDIFRVFNVERPEDFKGRSLSVSDVVEVYESGDVERGFYFCDRFGYEQVEFNPAECEVSEWMNERPQKISVLLVEPHKIPRIIEIGNDYRTLVKTIGDKVEEYMPFSDEVALVCGRSGNQNGAEMNRAIYSEPDEETGRREMLDIIFGKFIICHAPIGGETYSSLPDKLAQKYKEMFKNPERFYRENGNFVVEPYELKKKAYER